MDCIITEKYITEIYELEYKILNVDKLYILNKMLILHSLYDNFHEETLKAGLWYSRHPNNARKNYNATKELYIYLAYLIPIMYGDFCFQYVNYKHRLYELIGVYTYITKPLLKILFNTFKLYKHELKYRAISEVSVKLDDKHQNKNEMKIFA